MFTKMKWLENKADSMSLPKVNKHGQANNTYGHIVITIYNSPC